MISGPTVPNNQQGLRDLLVDRLDWFQDDLSVLAVDVILGRDASVDVLACDARGTPWFLIVAMSDTAPGLTARALGGLAWWRQNSSFLARELGAPQLRVDVQPRVCVVGLEVSADTLSELQSAGIPGLSVSQLCSVSIGGRLRLGLSPMFADVPHALPPAVAEDLFTVPEGVEDPEQVVLVEHFIELARLVDVGMTARGDRLSRQFYLDGRHVAQVGLVQGQILVEFPAISEDLAPACPVSAQSFVLDDATCMQAVDRMLRLALALELGSEGAMESKPARQEVRITNGVSESVTWIDTPPVRAAANGTAGDDRFSLEPIRRSVPSIQRVREEFTGLSEDASGA